MVLREYGAHKTLSKAGPAAVLAFVLYAMPAQAEHASSAHFESPLPPREFSGGNAPTERQQANYRKSRALPGAKPLATLPPLVGGSPNEIRITGLTVANRGVVAANTSLSSPFSDGYNAPQGSRSPKQLIPYDGRIGLSRVSSGVPRRGLSGTSPLAVQ